MDRETRSDKMFRELREFLDDSKKSKTCMTLYKHEAEKLEKYLYEQDISAEITEKRSINKSKVRITVQKM